MVNLLKNSVVFALISLAIIFGINKGLNYFFGNQIALKMKHNDATVEKELPDFLALAESLRENPVLEIQNDSNTEISPELLKRFSIIPIKNKVVSPQCGILQVNLSESFPADLTVDGLVTEVMLKLSTSVPNWIEIQKDLDLLVTRTSTDWPSLLTRDSFIPLSKIPEMQDFRATCFAEIEVVPERLMVEAFARFVKLVSLHQEVQAFSEMVLVNRLLFRSNYEPVYRAGVFLFSNVIKFLQERKFENEVFTQKNLDAINKFHSTLGWFARWPSHTDQFLVKIFETTPVSFPFCNAVSLRMQSDALLIQVAQLAPEKYIQIVGLYKKLFDRCLDKETLGLVDDKVKVAKNKLEHSLKNTIKYKTFGTVFMLQQQLDIIELDREPHL